MSANAITSNTLTPLASKAIARQRLMIIHLIFPMLYCLSFWKIREPITLSHWVICLVCLAPWMAMSLAIITLNRFGLMAASLLALVYLGFLSPGILNEPWQYYYLLQVLAITLSFSFILYYLRVTRIKA